MDKQQILITITKLTREIRFRDRKDLIPYREKLKKELKKNEN